MLNKEKAKVLIKKIILTLKGANKEPVKEIIKDQGLKIEKDRNHIFSYT